MSDVQDDDAPANDAPAHDAPADDVPADDAVWRALADGLRRGFRRRTSDPERVEDLVQQTLARALASLPDLRDGARLDAWVRSVARSVWVDALRRRDPLADAASDADPDALAAAEADEAAGASAEVAGWLAAAIDALPERDRDVLRRTELAGEPQRRVAAELGLSVSAVKARVRRGRARLRAELERCCRLELDRRGGVVAWTRRAPDACACDDAC